MRRVSGVTRPTGRAPAGAALVAAAVVLCFAAEIAAQDVTFIPVAPPEGAELAYNIPLQEWMIPPVLELKREFSDGLAAEFSDIAENQTGGDIRTLVESGNTLAEGAERLRAAILSISEIDVTFGIAGISRIIPAEGALRDTLFGFVVWHETPTRNSATLMREFEGLVEQVVSGGDACGALAAQLSDMEARLDEAIASEDMDTVAELAPGIVETSGRIDAICSTVAGTAEQLALLVEELSADSGTQLMDRWSETKAAVAQCMEPAAGTGDAYASVSEVLYLMIELGRLLSTAGESVRVLESAVVEDGMVYIPWTVMRDDWKIVEELEERILAPEAAHAEQHDEEGHDDAEHGAGEEAGSEEAAEHADQEAAGEHEDEVEQAADHDHAHSHEIPGMHVISGATDETRRQIRALYSYQVEANGILAERAVAYTSMAVGRAIDTLEAHYKEEADYDPQDDQRGQLRALAEVDEHLRENMPLVSARLSATGARVALGRGDELAAMGAGHEMDALYQYQNAWLHSLNAGNASQRSVLEIR